MKIKPIIGACSLALFLMGCTNQAMSESSAPQNDSTTASHQTEMASNPFAKPGFNVEEEDGRLWVLRPGEERSEKHATLIGAGPMRMSIKALERDTALEYIAAKPGFEVSIEDGRIWVLRPGQEKSEKHSTLIGAGPQNMSIKALDRETALEYLSTKPGFNVSIEDGRLWVLKGDQEKSEKHATLIGRGPQGMSLKALDNDTALLYLATKPGWEVHIEDGRVWVLRPGQEMSEKHSTRIGAGPLGKSIKALDQETIDLYLAS